MEDAKAKARQYFCRVAIVDMRLFEAESDESGLALASDLKPTFCIIVTAYGNIPATDGSRCFAANIVSFFEKGDDPKKLMGEVNNVFEAFCPSGIRTGWAWLRGIVQ